jgi:hypothetical protein
MGYRIYLVRDEVQMVAEDAAALDKNHRTRKGGNQVHPVLRVKRFITPVALAPHRVITLGVNGGPIRVSRSRVLVSLAIRVKVSDFSVIFLIQV